MCQNLKFIFLYFVDLINEFIIESSSSVFMNSDTVNKAFNLDWVVFHTLVSGLLSIQIKLLPFVPRKQFLYQTVFKNFIITGKVVKQFSFPRVIKNDSFLKFDSKIYIYKKVAKSESLFMYSVLLDQNFNRMNAEHCCQSNYKVWNY